MKPHTNINISKPSMAALNVNAANARASASVIGRMLLKAIKLPKIIPKPVEVSYSMYPEPKSITEVKADKKTFTIEISKKMKASIIILFG